MSWFIDHLATLAEKGNPIARSYLCDQAAKGDPDAREWIGLLGILPDQYPRCEHGPMVLREHKGRRGFVCILPKGELDRCPSVMITERN